MAYLDTPRLIFSGDFQADVSTVNNDVRHFDNQTFEARFQQPQVGKTLNGWWNPTGGAVFQLLNCTVRQVVGPDGLGSTSDPVVGQVVTNASDQSNGKVVDLDPQSQMVSQLWGVRLRLCTPAGDLLLSGNVSPTPFRDLQSRQTAPNPVNGQGVGASWTTVLTDVVWGDITRSPFLTTLRDQSEPGLLALNLNVFGYFTQHSQGRFTLGTVLGTIGPYHRGEPQLFAPARRLIGTPVNPVFSYTNFQFDERTNRLTLDFGQSFPVADPAGNAQNIGTLMLAVATVADVPLQQNAPTTIDPADCVTIGQIAYTTPNWLLETGGLVSVSVDAAAASLLADHQLLLLSDGTAGSLTVQAFETTQGLAVRADQFVQRLDPGNQASVDVYAYQWGKPLPNATVSLTLTAPTKAGGAGPHETNPPKAKIPFTCVPASAIHFPATVTTDSSGRAQVILTGDDPKNPRVYLDGQIYQIAYELPGLPTDQQYFVDQIVVHLRDGFTVPDHPTWNDVGPILTQYGNLYPIMSRFLVDLSKEADVLNQRSILLFAFTRDINEPYYMPVTRDLSEAKRQMLVRWLQQAQPADVSAAALAQALPADVEERTPLEPKAADFQRPPALRMRPAQLKQMTQGKGGKSEALLRLTSDTDSIEKP